QTFELWFKQILHELEGVCSTFSAREVPEKEIGLAVSRLNRIVEIQRVIIQQFGILETMTPLDFLDFRDYLIPASGFQSWQFRILETRLGLRSDVRSDLGGKLFLQALQPKEQAAIEEAGKKPSLLRLVESWLERTPFVQSKDFDFWKI